MSKSFTTFILALFLLTCKFSSAEATCPTTTGMTVFMTQAAVDNFGATYPTCTDLPGGIFIGSGVTDLTPFSNLTNIGGSIQLFQFAGTSLNGFHNLTNIDVHLGITECQNLTSLSSLSSLTSIGGDFGILDCDALTDFSGLNSLSAIGEDFVVNYCANIEDFNGLQNLTTIGGYANIADNASMNNFTGLDNLASLGGYLWIDDNDSMTSLTGLGRLASIGGYLRVELNDNLPTLAGLDILDYSSISNLTIENNPNLVTCEIQVICDFLSNGGTVNNISGNASNCASEGAVDIACLALPIELIRFDLVREEKRIDLNWSTLSEQDNLGFYIERSIDGRRWESIDFVEGSLNSTVRLDYIYSDYVASERASFYRLKQMDTDGHFSYSEIRYAAALAESISLYPNPASTDLAIEGYISGPVELTDLNGRTILLEINNGSVQIGKLKAGLYLLKINNQYLRFVKE